MIHGIIGTLCSPLYSFKDMAVAYIATKMDVVPIISKLDRQYEKIPDALQKKIDHFLAELHLKPDQFIFLNGIDSHSAASAKGAIRPQCPGIILLSPEFIKKIESNFDGTAKFVIAHEISHLLSDDFVGEFGRCYQISKTHLLAYCTSMIAMSYFLPYFVAHLGSISVAGAVKWVRWRQIKRPTELKADLWAAQQSKEIAQGAIQFLEDSRRKLPGYKDDFLQQLDTVDKQSNSCLKKCAARGIRRLVSRIPAETIASLVDSDHPSYSDRIAAISLLAVT